MMFSRLLSGSSMDRSFDGYSSFNSHHSNTTLYTDDMFSYQAERKLAAVSPEEIQNGFS